MLGICGKCGNFKDADNDKIGWCSMCHIFVTAESKCDIMPVDLDRTRLYIDSRKIDQTSGHWIAVNTGEEEPKENV